MGNVLASSQPPPKDCFPNLPPLPPIGDVKPETVGLSAETPIITEPKLYNDKIENPGPMEDLHKKCKDVYPVNFEGARVLLSRGFSSHFQVNHTLNLSSVTPSGYRFGATFIGPNEVSNTESYPILYGDVDPSGNLNANIINQFGKRLRSRFHTQIQGGKYMVSQIVSDYRGSDYTASLSVGNPDIFNDTVLLAGQYLQSVTPQLALGAEIAYQRAPHIPGNQLAFLSVGARYTGSDYSCSGTIGGNGLHLCLYQYASEQLQFGVELETNVRLQESVASIGYQIDIPRSEFVFKGLVDTNGNVGAVLEKKILPLPFTFALSGLINHNKNNFKLGVAFIIA